MERHVTSSLKIIHSDVDSSHSLPSLYIYRIQAYLFSTVFYRPLFFQRRLSSVGWSSGSRKVSSDSQDFVIDGGRSGILASGSGKGC
ncbi:hypothetical protein YC2023_042329 [Brassica napus]